MGRRFEAKKGESTFHIPCENAFGAFQNAYRSWGEKVRPEREREQPVSDTPSSCVIGGMGLLGKTAFIENEIVPYFASGKAQEKSEGLPNRTPIVAKCNYDAFDHAPSKLDVLVSLRNQLARQKVQTSHFDYGLKSYCEAIGISDWKMRLEDRADFSGLSKMIDDWRVLLDRSLPFMPIINKCINGVRIAGKIVRASMQMAEIISAKQCIDEATAEEILEIMDGLLLEDIRRATLKSLGCTSNPSASKPIAVCIILDAVERSAAGVFWEQSIAKCSWCFTVLSGREISKDGLAEKEYVSLVFSKDAKNVSEKILGDAVKELPPALVEACEGVPGFVKIIAATTGMGAQAKSEVVQYLSLKLGKGFNGWAEEQDLSAALGDILSIQMKYLPRDQVQVLYVMAWFGPASPRWLCEQLPSMLQPHSRAMSELRDLPYVYEEGDRWRIHALVAHCLRYLCDSLTMDIVIGNLEKKIPPEPTRPLSEDQMEVAEALVRLQSGRLAAEMRGLADKDSLAALWDITAGDAGGLEEWANLVIKLLSGSDSFSGSRADGVVTEFNDLLLKVLQWNEGRRGRPDSLVVNSKLALETVEAYRKLRKLYGFQQLPKWTRLRIVESSVSALLRCGAILSDQSRGQSEAKLHHSALKQEADALSLVLDEFWGREAGEKASVLLSGCLNAVAISSYRLRGYKFAIPLFEHLYSLAECYGRTIGSAKKSQYLRNYGACLYGYACDVLIGIAEVIHDKPADEEAKRSAEKAIEVLVEAISENPSLAWPAILTEASCYAIVGSGSGGVKDESLELLQPIREEIIEKGQERSEYYSRCCLLLAERYEKLGSCNLAYFLAGESYVARHEVKGSRHIDTRKSAQYLGDLRNRCGFTQLPWEMKYEAHGRFPFLRRASTSSIEDLWPEGETVLLTAPDVDLYKEGLREDEECLLCNLVKKLSELEES